MHSIFLIVLTQWLLCNDSYMLCVTGEFIFYLEGQLWFYDNFFHHCHPYNARNHHILNNLQYTVHHYNETDPSYKVLRKNNTTIITWHFTMILNPVLVTSDFQKLMVSWHLPPTIIELPYATHPLSQESSRKEQKRQVAI